MTGGIAALALIPQPAPKLLTSAALFAVAAGRALRRYLFAAPVRAELGDYPFDARRDNPWERDKGPSGL